MRFKFSLLPSPGGGSIKTLRKRGVRLRRKVERKVAEEKDHRNIKFRKAERKQTGVENSNKPRKLGKKEKQKERKKDRKTKKSQQKKKRKTEKKMKKILKMKK